MRRRAEKVLEAAVITVVIAAVLALAIWLGHGFYVSFEGLQRDAVDVFMNVFGAAMMAALITAVVVVAIAGLIVGAAALAAEARRWWRDEEPATKPPPPPAALRDPNVIPFPRRSDDRSNGGKR